LQASEKACASAGYIEGQNLAFVLRYAPDDPGALRTMLPDILATPADLVVSSGPAIQAMRAATNRPVLFAISGDPVELGIAESLARPGRNFTGSTFMSLDVAQKRVELLKELLPELRTLAVLSNTNHPGERSEHDATRAVADALSIRMAYVPFGSAAELEGALERVRTSGADALLVFPEGRHHGAPSADCCPCQVLSPTLDVRLARVLRCGRACELWG
jgi:putative ABC transport system substrate-binding protein